MQYIIHPLMSFAWQDHMQHTCKSSLTNDRNSCCCFLIHRKRLLFVYAEAERRHLFLGEKKRTHEGNVGETDSLLLVFCFCFLWKLNYICDQVKSLCHFQSDSCKNMCFCYFYVGDFVFLISLYGSLRTLRNAQYKQNGFGIFLRVIVFSLDFIFLIWNRLIWNFALHCLYY